MFRIVIPNFGPDDGPKKFNQAAMATGHDSDLGGLYIKPNGDYWQICQNVDGAGVSGTNITGGGVAYWKNYAGYQVTPTIGNSSVNEVAGIYELVVTQNYFCAIRQGGTRKVKAAAGTYVRGTPLVAASSANAVAAGGVAASTGVITAALTALDTGGGVMSVVNPFGQDAFVDRLLITTTVKSTGASTTDFGVTPTTATTSANNLLTGLDTGTATVTADNFTNPGASGKGRQFWPTGAWVTGSKASGAEAGLVGTYAIYYTIANAGPNRVIGVALGARDGDGNVNAKLKIIPA